MALETIYEEIPIAYDEAEDVWRFSLRGRERTAPSLAKAKEAIDKPVAEAKAKEFQRVRAIKIDIYGASVIFGEITSIADTTDFLGNHDAWFSGETGRRKESIAQLHADTPENRAIIEKAKALKKQSNELGEESRKLLNSCAKLEIAIPE